MAVNILTPDVVSKIAAGEVVERPASVVKELLENAIDAGADSIEINLKDAGKELIHLKDNGCGIAHDDMEKIFQRHATSKISTMEDMERLSSMGFRGEALYSIAAISDVRLSSRVDGQEAWQIHLKGGLRHTLEPVAFGQAGSDIKITELFFNTPARRKFLKNNTSELNQILNIVLPYTIIYPDKHFVLTHAGRCLLDLRPAASCLDRLGASLGVSMRHFLETDQSFPEEALRAHLILGDINIQRPRRDMQFIFINHRPVESKNLSFNLNDIYKLILPPGVYGAFVCDITLRPEHVDVNIHPTKRQVRLKDEWRIISILRRMTEYQLMHKGGAREITGGTPEITQTSGTPFRHPPHDLDSPIKASGGDNRQMNAEHDMRDFQLFSTENTLRSKLERARFVGSFLNKFLIFETEESLLIVDQHAAQERVMFEKFKTQIEKSRLEIQPLLTPLLLKLTPQEKIAWQESQDNLSAAGIETTLFDEDTLAVQTQPILLKNMERVVRAILAGETRERHDKDALARRACKASVVAGQKLDAEEATWQRQELLACADPFVCPHGRPTVIEITQDFLNHQFLRT